MPKALVVLTLSLAVVACMAGDAVAASESRVIVVLEDGAGDPGTVAAEHGRRFGARVSNVYRSALRAYAATVPSDRVGSIRADRRVEFVSPDRDVHALAQNLPTGIIRIEGDLSSTRSGDGAGRVGGPAVAVIDTGSGPHSDINVVGGKNCSSGKSYSDGNGHGTHVAGTIAARDDAAGVVGVAPGAPIYSVRVLNNSGSGSTSSVVCGIDWVAANAAARNIKVANMSLGGTGSPLGNQTCTTTTDAERKAICKATAAGVTLVVAAGNSGWDFDFAPAPDVPAAYPEVLTVTAVSDSDGKPGATGGAPTCRAGEFDDEHASFTNYAATAEGDAHTIAAPGVCIRSTWKGGAYNTISGTSMASPHVAGSATLCIASGACAGLGPVSIIAKLRDDAAGRSESYGFSGDPFGPIAGRNYGHLLYAGVY
jgi:subtilisin